MNALGHDEKLTESVTIKVSPSLKQELDKIPESLKHKLILKLRQEMRYAAHVAKFDPSVEY